MTSHLFPAVLQSLQTTTVLTGGSHNEYPSWSEPTITKTDMHCFNEHHLLRTIPEKAWRRAASPETPPLCACGKTSQKNTGLVTVPSQRHQYFPGKQRFSTNLLTVSNVRTEGSRASTSRDRKSCHFPLSQGYYERWRQSLDYARAFLSVCLSYFSHLGTVSECHNSLVGHSLSQRCWPNFPQLHPRALSSALSAFAWVLHGEMFHLGGWRSNFWQTSNIKTAEKSSGIMEYV